MKIVLAAILALAPAFSAARARDPDIGPLLEYRGLGGGDGVP